MDGFIQCSSDPSKPGRGMDNKKSKFSLIFCGILGTFFVSLNQFLGCLKHFQQFIFWMDFCPPLTPASQPRWITPSLFLFFFETFPYLVYFYFNKLYTFKNLIQPISNDIGFVYLKKSYILWFMDFCDIFFDRQPREMTLFSNFSIFLRCFL